MQKFSLIYTRTAIKDIKKLDAVVKKKLSQKILLYVKDPIHYATRLIDSAIGTYRWRIGNYRIIFDIDEKNNRIVVLKVGHRRDIYNSL